MNLTCLLFISWQHEDYIYISDWQAKAIERFSKLTGRGRTVIQDNLEGLMDIHVVAPSRQTGKKTNDEFPVQALLGFPESM